MQPRRKVKGNPTKEQSSIKQEAIHLLECGCVLCWVDSGRALPVVVCCVSCFVRVCHYLQCACPVVPTCVQASLVLLLMPIVLYAWCYIVLLHSL